MADIKVGNKVEHSLYGVGVVTNIDAGAIYVNFYKVDDLKVDVEELIYDVIHQ